MLPLCDHRDPWKEEAVGSEEDRFGHRRSTMHLSMQNFLEAGNGGEKDSPWSLQKEPRSAALLTSSPEGLLTHKAVRG